MSDDTDRLARKLGAAANLAHGFVYFAPELAQAYDDIGLTAAQHYFASRAAPMGAVEAGTVEAVFFNFNPELVRAAIPSAWSVADPATVQQARLDGVAAVFDRIELEVDAAELATGREALHQMIAGVDFAGKPLAAGNRDVTRPDDPLLDLWQLTTVVREWRGDAHNAVLAATPHTAVEALVLHAATGKVPESALRDTRAWSDDAWQRAVGDLAAQGLVDATGTFTEAGRTHRSDIERRTDRACRPLVTSIGEEATGRLVEILDGVGQQLLAAGLYAAFTR